MRKTPFHERDGVRNAMLGGLLACPFFIAVGLPLSMNYWHDVNNDIESINRLFSVEDPGKGQCLYESPVQRQDIYYVGRKKSLLSDLYNGIHPAREMDGATVTQVMTLPVYVERPCATMDVSDPSVFTSVDEIRVAQSENIAQTIENLKAVTVEYPHGNGLWVMTRLTTRAPHVYKPGE